MPDLVKVLPVGGEEGIAPEVIPERDGDPVTFAAAPVLVVAAAVAVAATLGAFHFDFSFRC